MKKPRRSQPKWVANLHTLMTARQLNPRSLSLKAGLNATAVRDMLEGRTRFPRYDTVLALSHALDVTPTGLMDGQEKEANNPVKSEVLDGDLELLTEIITRLQEVIEEYKHPIGPRDFAAMVASLYRRMQTPQSSKGPREDLQPKIYDLLEYETMRRRAQR
ncbi:MAG: helix-turn-helix transcriptional regulator [Alphaproteobacteria bacterium]|nr:helix-turn-helix transcriptional regulator [Alphaproteobacteria bacterium]